MIERASSDERPFPVAPFILPAIDLRGGRVVRLLRGAGDAEIGYDAEPLETARRWQAEGGRCLHIIDLGGALGEASSLDVLARIASSLELPVQAGGGIRDGETVDRVLDCGVSRVILGTRALRDADFLRQMIDRHGPERIVLAMDVADGRVKVAGWTEASSLDLPGGIDFAVENGVSALLVTAIDRDGTLSGPNLPLVRQTLDLAGARGLRVVVAGGIGKLEDIRSVLELRSSALEAVVVGRALYEETVELERAVELADSFRG